MPAVADISPLSPKSLVKLVPFFPVFLGVLILVILFLLSEHVSAQVATVLFAHVDRGLTIHSLVPFVFINAAIGTVGFTYGPGLIAGGFLFGFWGGIASCAIVELITATSCFLVGRYVFRARCRAWYENQAVPLAVKAAVGKFEQKELLNLVLFRMIPMPGCMKNYLPALLNVSFFSYFIAVCVEVVAYAPWMAYLGYKSEGFARAYAESHDMLTGSVEVRPTQPYVWPALGLSALLALVLMHLAAREFSESKDFPELSVEHGTVLSPLVDPATLESHELKPMREHTRL